MLNWANLASMLAKVISPTIFIFLILGFIESRSLIAALKLTVRVTPFLAAALFLNLLLAPKSFGRLILPGETMNFTGQIAMAAFGLLFIFSKDPNFRRDTGIRVFLPKSIFILAVAAGFAICGIGFLEDLVSNAPFPKDVNYFQKFLFEATLPGISEEIVFRGVLLTMANRFFVKRWRFLGAQFGLGLIAVSLPFGLGHLISTHEMTFAVASGRFVSTFTSALILGWIKERTSSLPACMVAHNIANSIGTVIDYLGK